MIIGTPSRSSRQDEQCRWHLFRQVTKRSSFEISGATVSLSFGRTRSATSRRKKSWRTYDASFLRTHLLSSAKNCGTGLLSSFLTRTVSSRKIRACQGAKSVSVDRPCPVVDNSWIVNRTNENSRKKDLCQYYFVLLTTASSNLILKIFDTASSPMVTP